MQAYPSQYPPPNNNNNNNNNNNTSPSSSSSNTTSVDDEQLLQLCPENILNLLAPFQKEAVSFAIAKNGRVLIADEMGLGTLVILLSKERL